jgi:hypothetical protein
MAIWFTSERANRLKGVEPGGINDISLPSNNAMQMRNQNLIGLVQARAMPAPLCLVADA